MNSIARDRLRGLMWSNKCRGRLEDYDNWNQQLSNQDRGTILTVDKKVSKNHRIRDEVIGGAKHRLGWGSYKWKYNEDVINQVTESGLVLIDTAESYGYGKVETELGKIYSRTGCKAKIATKVARNHMSKSAVINAGLRSRDRLKVSSIFLYQIHWPNYEGGPSVEQTCEGLAELLDNGTVLHVGVSNHSLGQITAVRRCLMSLGYDLSSVQVRLNSNDLGACESILPYCKSVGMLTLGHSTLDQGRLRKTASEAFTEASRWVDIPLVGTNNPDHIAELTKKPH